MRTIINNSIDVAKGGLIFLVVLGHLLLGSLNNNFLRFFIFSFHMSMFIFISGYLVKIEKLTSRPFTAFLTHYAKRMLGWWIVAWCFYTGLSLVKKMILRRLSHS